MGNTTSQAFAVENKEMKTNEINGVAADNNEMETTQINGVSIRYHHSTTNAGVLQAFPPLLEWTSRMRETIRAHNYDLRDVKVLHVYMFGPRAGFVLLDAEVYTTKRRDGPMIKLPGAVLLRGKSVAVLPWRETTDGKIEVLLITQPRVATGGLVMEAPAGMIDPGGTCVGTAFNEVKEETGLVISMADLTEVGKDIVLSPGLCDEEISLYTCRIPHDERFDASMVQTGELGESNEVITKIQMVGIDDMSRRSNVDAKTTLLIDCATKKGIF